MKQKANAWILLSIVFSLGVLLISWMFFASPQINTMNANSSKITKSQQDNTNEQNRITQLSKLSDSQKADLQNTYEAYNNSIPDAKNDTSFFSSVSTAQNSAGVGVASITVNATTTSSGKSKNASSSTGLTSYPITITGSGQENDILSFVKNLQTGDRFFTVTALSIQSGQSGVYQFTLTGNIYSRK